MGGMKHSFGRGVLTRPRPAARRRGAAGAAGNLFIIKQTLTLPRVKKMDDSSDDEVADDSVVGRFLSGFMEEEFVATCGMHKSVFNFLWDKYSHEARDDSPLKYPLRRLLIQSLFSPAHIMRLFSRLLDPFLCTVEPLCGAGIICTK